MIKPKREVLNDALEAPLPPPPVFVFGSNLAGRHGAGAALHARRYYGAIYGVGMGRQGNSYAIPTKTAALARLGLDDIRYHVEQFVAYARLHRGELFQVTNIGCGLAGYKPAQIAPLFKGAPENCLFSSEFLPYVRPQETTHEAG